MWEIFDQFGIWSLVDVLLIAFVIYQMFILLKGTHAAQMLTGISVVISAAALSAFAPLTALNWLISKFYPSFIIIVVILFQDEFRRMLRKLGKRSFMLGVVKPFATQELLQISEAVSILAQRHVGALIVIERDIVLNQYLEMGATIDARISRDLIISIFQQASPIHDGAITIQDERITAAGCFLPLTRQTNLSPEFGTRHRAAIGISQETDAAVIVVSEEHGVISWVEDGKVTHNINLVALEYRLEEVFSEQQRAQEQS